MMMQYGSMIDGIEYGILVKYKRNENYQML
jgi:hypothetical protein